MINDLSLPANISSTYLWKFADDTTTSESIPPNGGCSLQENLNHTYMRMVENKFLSDSPREAQRAHHFL